MSGINQRPAPEFELTLDTGGDYIETARWKDGDFPSGSELHLLIGAVDASTEHAFAITGDTATLRIESEVADLIDDGELYRLRYRDTTTTPTTEKIICWGYVRRTP